MENQLEELKKSVLVYKGHFRLEEFPQGTPAPDARKISGKIRELEPVDGILKVVGGLRDWYSNDYFPFFILAQAELKETTLNEMNKSGYQIEGLIPKECFQKEWSLDCILNEYG